MLPRVFIFLFLVGLGVGQLGAESCPAYLVHRYRNGSRCGETVHPVRKVNQSIHDTDLELTTLYAG